MGGGNREQRQAQQTFNTTLAETKAESPYERTRREFAEGVTKFAEGGDYRNPTGAMKVFFNFADPAEQKRRAELNANTRGTGVSALGAGANPTALALDKQHRDAVNERDTAANYQQTLSQVVGGAYDELGDLQGADTAKKLNILGSTQAQLQQQNQIQASKPRWWQVLMGNAQQGTKAAMTGGA
jgi:hypothetical protein